jgi:phosphoribosyl-ATP pyrophosphohydrolase/phosphoribosyl-AMP cyclohydrolase
VDAEELFGRLRPDEHGLVPAIVVHADDQRVLMLGYMNRDALAATLEHGRVTFFSRSRGCLWEKGEQSGHTLVLRELRIDCDVDALLVSAEPRGPTCHTGRASCFYVRVDPRTGSETSDEGPPRDAFARLERVISTRLSEAADGRSYVRELAGRGVDHINAKIVEEASELCFALRSENDERVAAEAADLVFHVLVGLAHRGVALEDVAAVLRARDGQSGLEEKARRGSAND